LLGAIRDPQTLLEAARYFDQLGFDDAEQDYYRIKAHEHTDPELLALPEGSPAPDEAPEALADDRPPEAQGRRRAGLALGHARSLRDRGLRPGRAPGLARRHLIGYAGSTGRSSQYVEGMAPCRAVDVDDIAAG
jgi:hypothetical protein